MGRSTYDQMLTFGAWPYGSRRGLVLTSRPIGKRPDGVRTVTADELASALDALRAEVRDDVWIVGGGRTARACLDARRVDEFELYIVPHILGEGIPLLHPRDAPTAMRLLDTLAFNNGVLRARYAIEREPAPTKDSTVAYAHG